MIYLGLFKVYDFLIFQVDKQWFRDDLYFPRVLSKSKYNGIVYN